MSPGTDPTPGPDLALVSVVFEAEVGLQLLQARSVARYVPAGAVREMVLVDNSRRGLSPAVREELLHAYGPHADRLQVLRPGDIGPLPRAVGWRQQQVLKLMVARRLSSARYVLLDAKNHFVDSWTSAAFVAPDGRMRARAYSYAEHPLRADLEHVLRYLGVDPAPHVERFTATVTPFVLDVAMVVELLDDIEQRSGRPFAREFVSNDLTEFFLVSGWLVATGRPLGTVYATDMDTGPTLWPRGVTPEGVAEAVARARTSMVFGVHRRALAALEPELARPVAELWAERGLFGSVAEAEAFVASSRVELVRQARAQRNRDLPTRLLAAPRALRRRITRAARRRRGR